MRKEYLSGRRTATVVLAGVSIAAAWPRFESRLCELYPYDVPEIVAVKPEQVAESYARWVGESVL